MFAFSGRNRFFSMESLLRHFINSKTTTSQKTAPPLKRVAKKCLQNWAQRISKEAEFCADFKNVQKFRVWQKGKHSYIKTEFLGEKIF
jgi:hypothetical protein